MAGSINYQYINEANIDSELICIICNSPFNDPLCTPCDHTFCRECITRWIGGRNRTCPVCNRQLTSVNDLVPANRIVRNMLDRLPVICIFCAKTGLQRGNFNDHTTKACSKVHVPCPSADIKCPWNGPRDQLDNHVTTCVFQPFRTILTELITKNLQLEEKINQQNTTMRQQDAQMKQQDAQTKASINQLSSKFSLFLPTVIPE